MKITGWHCLLVLVLGYLIGYYWRGLGNATVARVIPISRAA